MVAARLDKDGQILESLISAILVEKSQNQENKNPVELAEKCQNKKYDQLAEKRQMLDEGDIDGKTALMVGVVSGNLKSVSLLLLHGANVSQTDNDGKTSIHHCVTSRNNNNNNKSKNDDENNSYKILLLLLKYVGDQQQQKLNQFSLKAGATPLHLAV